MLIRIPVPNAEVAGAAYVLEFDSDAITVVSSPREVAVVGCADDGCPGCGAIHRHLAGPNQLILGFATLDDAPKWVPG